VQVVQLKRRLL